MISLTTESGTGGKRLVSYDDKKVTALSSQLVQACGYLKDLGLMQKDIVMRDPHLIAGAKYHLIVGTEAAIDLANHLIAKNRWRAPEDYADTFRIMEEQGLVDAAFSVLRCGNAVQAFGYSLVECRKRSISCRKRAKSPRYSCSIEKASALLIAPYR